jgi:predicted Zn-dependent protease
MTIYKSVRSLLCTFLYSVLLFCGVASPALKAQGLPELSDSASLIMNSEQEKMFGKQVMLNVRAQSNFSSDVLLQNYFIALANSLARHSPRDFGVLTVGLAIDPAINAFAVPGGYITINTGLIQNTRNEAELASVIAHEIGHQSQRHISRSIERSKQLNLPAMAAMIGGILIGGQAGTAAVISAQAAVASDQLSYSRTFEREADATGMNILAAAGYDPNAMPSFFSQLEKQSRLYGGIILEFLSTHPVSSDRIADGRSRASRLTPELTLKAPPADRLDFEHAKARTLALYDEPVETVIKRFEYTLNDKQASAQSRQVAEYGLAIAYIRNEQFEKSSATLQDLRRKAPANPLYQLAEAELAFASGNLSRAELLYGELYQADPSHTAYIEGYTRVLLTNGKSPAAIRILRKTIRHRPELGWANGLLARAYAADNKTLNAIFIEAQQLKNAGLYTRALQLLHQQSRQTYPDSSEYMTASINGLIKQIEEEKRQLDNFEL